MKKILALIILTLLSSCDFITGPNPDEPNLDNSKLIFKFNNATDYDIEDFAFSSTTISKLKAGESTGYIVAENYVAYQKNQPLVFPQGNIQELGRYGMIGICGTGLKSYDDGKFEMNIEIIDYKDSTYSLTAKPK